MLPSADSSSSPAVPQAFVVTGLPSHSEINIADPGLWRPLDEAHLTLDDWGLIQGATLVERLRTVRGQPLDDLAHLKRLAASADVLGIHIPKYLTCKVIDECIERSKAANQGQDVGVVILLTPGRTGDRPIGHFPTVIVHTTPLHWPQLAHWYRYGQPLILGDSRNVPGVCWSPHIKTRSRLHYYLADTQALASGLPFAGAVMLSVDGHVTESSVANLMLVRDGGLFLPPPETVLQGLSLQRTLRLAAKLNIGIQYKAISVDEAQQSDAILMTGSSGCLWPASELAGVKFSAPTKHPIYLQLQAAWIEDLGLDYVSQATLMNRPSPA